MAKSIRSKDKKRWRAEQRATVGEKQVRKALRKTTRKLLRDMTTKSSAKISSDDLKQILAGAGGASASLVTLEPKKKKKLRYTFNTGFRQHRLDEGLEDETDDEAEDDEEEQNEDGAADADEMGDDAEAEVEQSGMKKSVGKPVPKREMTTEYYKWQDLDLANPHSAGAFDVTGGKSDSRKRWAEKRKKGRAGGKGKKSNAGQEMVY